MLSGNKNPKGIWKKKPKGLWHRGVLITLCGLRVDAPSFTARLGMPNDLGRVCWKCRHAIEGAKKGSGNA